MVSVIPYSRKQSRQGLAYFVQPISTFSFNLWYLTFFSKLKIPGNNYKGVFQKNRIKACKSTSEHIPES